MTARRLSHLQKQILSWLWRDEQRTRGMISSSHPELVGALPATRPRMSEVATSGNVARTLTNSNA